MSKFIDYEDYVPYAPDEPGKTVNRHHCKTGSGNDRMYITRSEDGSTILAFCHHCNQRGVYNCRPMEARKSARRNKESFVTSTRTGARTIRLPKDFTRNLADFSARGVMWLKQYDITDEEIDTYGIGYSASMNRIILPIYQDGKLAMFQARRLDDKEENKYLTFKAEPAQFLVTNADYCHHLVVVEDMLSAIKVGRVCSATALLGTGMSESRVNFLRKNFSIAHIWLDDDNREVRKAQLVLKNKFELYFKEVSLITKVGKDPKCLNTKEIKSVLDLE